MGRREKEKWETGRKREEWGRHATMHTVRWGGKGTRGREGKATGTGKRGGVDPYLSYQIISLLPARGGGW